MRGSFALFVVAFASLAPFVQGAELGRHPVGGATGNVPVEQTYRSATSESGPGLEASLDWGLLDWDFGDASYDDAVFLPAVAVSYGLSPWVDLRFTTRFATAEDGEGDLDLLRLGIGSRVWFDWGQDVLPYVGLAANYYVLNSDEADDVDGTVGLSTEIGIAYLADESVMLRMGVQWETTLRDAEADVGDDQVDISLSVFSFGFGIAVLF